MNISKINIENEKYTCDEAMAIVESEINTLLLSPECKILKIVHGYGSSGKGGTIKKALIPLLQRLKKQKMILDFCQNELFSPQSQKYKTFTKLYPSLILDHDLANQNPGITIIFLRN